MSLAYHEQQGHYVLVQICQIFFAETSSKPGLLLVQCVTLYGLIFRIAIKTYTLATSQLHIHIFENYLLHLHIHIFGHN